MNKKNIYFLLLFFNFKNNVRIFLAGMSRSVPSSPGDRKGQQGSIPIVGSAESLVGRVCINQPIVIM